MAFVSEIEAVALKSCLEPVGVIDEKFGVVNVMFVAEFVEKDFVNPVVYVEKRRI